VSDPDQRAVVFVRLDVVPRAIPRRHQEATIPRFGLGRVLRHAAALGTASWRRNRSVFLVNRLVYFWVPKLVCSGYRATFGRVARNDHVVGKNRSV
jgi:hypothetical protein